MIAARRMLASGTVVVAAALVAFPAHAQGPGATASPELTTVMSASAFDSTLARLERAAVAKGLTVALKLDHTAAAKRAGLVLPPTTLVIAGNPAAGTPLMQADQTMGVELPLRFLVWQGPDGRTRVSYDPIKAIAARHKVAGKDDVLARMTTAIAAIVADATR